MAGRKVTKVVHEGCEYFASTFEHDTVEDTPEQHDKEAVEDGCSGLPSNQACDIPCGAGHNRAAQILPEVTPARAAKKFKRSRRNAATIREPLCYKVIRIFNIFRQKKFQPPNRSRLKCRLLTIIIELTPRIKVTRFPSPPLG
jgi:hypothetical protein